MYFFFSYYFLLHRPGSATLFLLWLGELLAIVLLYQSSLGSGMLKEGIAVFFIQCLDAHLLTVHHSPDTVVAALHLEHGKMVYLLTVLGFEFIELIQGNGLG